MTKIYDWLVYFWGEWVSSVTPIPDDITKYMNIIALILMMIVILSPVIMIFAVFGIVRSARTGNGRYSG